MAAERHAQRPRGEDRQNGAGQEPEGLIFVVAPIGRDAELACARLERAGVSCTACRAVADLPEAFAEEAEALLLGEEALTRSAQEQLAERLRAQPPWSKLPVVVLADPEAGRAGEERRAALREALPGVHLTVLERRLRSSTLTAVVEGVLQDRRVQREMRELMARLERTNQGLEEKVAARTADLERRYEQVQTLAEALTRAEHAERRRIAQLLHDDLQQRIYGFRMHAQRLRNGVPPKEEAEVLAVMDDLAAEALRLTRTLTTDLSPPALEAKGFAAALEWLVTRMEERHGLDARLEGAWPSDAEPREEVRVLLYRLVQELLFNVVKHAGTRRATITASRQGNQLTVAVEDEGAGFDPSQVKGAFSSEGDFSEGDFGLISARERLALFGGEVRLETAPGEGTRVMLRVPLQDTEQHP